MVCGVIARNDGDELNGALKAVQSTTPNEIVTLTTAYKNASIKNLKTQILSLYALSYSHEELKKLHEPFEKLRDRQI